MTKAEIQKLKDRMDEVFDKYDAMDEFTRNAIDNFATLSWDETMSDVIGTVFEIQTPEEWSVASDMFCAFTGITLEDALNDFCGNEVG